MARGRGKAGGAPANPGLTTMQVWSILLIDDIVVNYEQNQDLMALSAQAGSGSSPISTPFWRVPGLGPIRIRRR